MSGEETRLLYFFSATAQTLGALLGIGIVSLTFYAQWLSKKRQELLNDLIDAIDLINPIETYNMYTRAKEFKKLEYKFFTEKIAIIEKKLLNNLKKNSLNDYQKKSAEIVLSLNKKYNSTRIAIPFGYFVFCTIVCSATIIICLISILYVEILFH